MISVATILSRATVFLFGLNPDEITKTNLRSAPHGFSSPTAAVQLGARVRFFDMKEILLKNTALMAMVDDEDYESLAGYSWCLSFRGVVYRSVSRLITKNGTKKHIYIHRQIMGFPDRMVIDHINHNRLDNQKSNLRICTIAENSRNRIIDQKRKTSDRKSAFKGVVWSKKCKKWMAQIKFNYKNIHLGVFDSEVDAAASYNAMAEKLFGDFALLNQI